MVEVGEFGKPLGLDLSKVQETQEKLRILALETSSRQTSIALFDHHKLVASQSASKADSPPVVRSSSAHLIPDIKLLFDNAGFGVRDVNVIALTTGPGSFTGLRIGITTAKTLAFATGAKIIGINTLLVIARQAQNTLDQLNSSSAQKVPPVNRLKIAINAQRSQLFTADVPNSEIADCETLIQDRKDWLDELRPGDAVCGPGLKPLTDNLMSTDGVFVLPQTSWEPDAATVGEMAVDLASRDEFDDLWKLQPQYFRPSYAHENKVR